MKTENSNLCETCGHEEYPHHIDINSEVGECAYNMNFENQDLEDGMDKTQAIFDFQEVMMDFIEGEIIKEKNSQVKK